MKPNPHSPHVRVAGRSAMPTACVVAIAAVLGACAPSQDHVAVETGDAIPTGVDDPSGSCRLVSDKEMSAILDGEVVAVQRPLNGGQSWCDYYAVGSRRRVLTLTLERDSLDTARGSVDAPLHHGAATAAQPYADIGDQVGQAFDGRMLVVVVGSDLLNFNLAEVPGDRHAVVKRIVDVATPRLRR